MGGVKLIVSTDGNTKTFYLPLKMIIKYIMKTTNKNKEKAGARKEVWRKAAQCLKKYKKQYGSFVLLELTESENLQVKIII